MHRPTTCRTSPRTTTAPDPNTYISFAFTGDVLTHTPLIEQAQRTAIAKGSTAEYDFTPMFEDVKQFVQSADLAMCHLETPIAPDGEELSAFPFFGVPKEVVTAIANAGFDRCSTASNHTYDRGLDGIDATVNALLENGVDQSGMARTPDEIEPRIVEVKGVRLCFLSYTFSYNGLKLPEGQEWRSAVINPDRILRDAERARQLGSEATIVSMHWGNEKESQANSMQTGIAETLTASGFDRPHRWPPRTCCAADRTSQWRVGDVWAWQRALKFANRRTLASKQPGCSNRHNQTDEAAFGKNQF